MYKAHSNFQSSTDHSRGFTTACKVDAIVPILQLRHRCHTAKWQSQDATFAAGPQWPYSEPPCHSSQKFTDCSVCAGHSSKYLTWLVDQWVPQTPCAAGTWRREAESRTGDRFQSCQAHPSSRAGPGLDQTPHPEGVFIGALCLQAQPHSSIVHLYADIPQGRGRMD